MPAPGGCSAPETPRLRRRNTPIRLCPAFDPNLPAFQPSNLPTFQPSNLLPSHPSNLPTFQPPNLPTFQPSNLPTSQPPNLLTYRSRDTETGRPSSSMILNAFVVGQGPLWIL